MKLNIEELAKEAGFGNYAYEAKGIFEAFTRLIVERCAVECDKEQREWSEFSDGHVAFRETAAKIRNLLENK